MSSSGLVSEGQIEEEKVQDAEKSQIDLSMPTAFGKRPDLSDSCVVERENRKTGKKRSRKQLHAPIVLPRSVTKAAALKGKFNAKYGYTN